MEIERPQINWARLVGSEVWQQEIVPMLNELRRAAMEAAVLLPEGEQSIARKAEARAYERILTLPQQELEAARLEREQAQAEEREDAGRRRTAIGWLRRRPRDAASGG